jgi:hypothetical protein
MKSTPIVAGLLYQVQIAGQIRLVAATNAAHALVIATQQLITERATLCAS